MKNKLTKLLLMLSKYSFYGLVIQVFLINLLFAVDVRSQKAESVFKARISIGLKDASLITAFRAIESRTSYRFIFDKEDIGKSVTVNLSDGNSAVSDVLKHLSKICDLTFKQINNNIYVKKNTRQGYVEKIEVHIQTRVINGKVTSYEDDEGLPGVNVIEKGTTNGTVTDVEGNYSLEVSEGATVVFSSVGYVTEEVSVTNQSVINIVMLPDIRQLQDITITALGFKKESDKMGASVDKVSGDDLVKASQPGLLGSLAGKASGVQIIQSAGDPGAGSYIQIRGQNTITGSFQPLIIINGIPVDGSVPFQRAGSGDTDKGVVQQSRLNDINVDDIESIQVLKGASAAALWGSRASNGVIMITTKSGKASEKVNISFRSTLSIEEANVIHPLQNRFGQGSNGEFQENFIHSWGDRIADRAGGADVVDNTGEFFVAESGDVHYPVTSKNSRETFTGSNIDAVFRNGHYFENVLTLSGGKDNAAYYFSLGDVNHTGVIRNSDYRRTAIRFNSNKNFGKLLQLTTNASYITTTSNRIQRGSNLSGLGLALYRTPPDFDIRDYKGTYFPSPDAGGVPFAHRAYRNALGSATPVYSNPLWIVNELENTQSINRFIMSGEAILSPVNNFDIIARAGVDTYSDETTTYFPVNTRISGGALEPGRTGAYEEMITNYTEINFDLIGKFNKRLSEDVMADWLVGMNLNQRETRMLGGVMTDFIVPDGPRDFSNAVNDTRNPFDTEILIRNSRGYTSLNLDLFEHIFFSASLAAETSSTFGDLSNDLYLYPSVEMAWTFNSLRLFQNLDWFSFGKLRGSAGSVGVQPDPYRTNTVFSSGSVQAFGINLNGGLYGNGALIQSSTRGSADLSPEIKTEWEIGTDLRFFDNRLSTALTYYQNKIEDLLLLVQVPASTGFNTQYTNAGSMQNRGFEIELTYNIIRNQNWQWTVNLNGNTNRNEVLDIGGNASIDIGGSGISRVVAIPGEQLGVFFDGGYLRDENNGSLVLDDNGFPLLAPESQVIGDPNPDWRGGFGTSLSYKNWSLNVLFETFQGADFFEGTRSVLNQFGTHEDTGQEITLDRDLRNYAGEVIPAGSTVRGQVRDFGGGAVLLDESYYTGIGGGLNGLIEPYITDGSWTRLREITLGYTLKSARFRELTKLSSVEFYVTGKNLFLWTDVVGIDPETNLNGAALSRGIDYFNSPGIRSAAFTVKINY